jgi:hypothetical protein
MPVGPITGHGMDSPDKPVNDMEMFSGPGSRPGFQALIKSETPGERSEDPGPPSESNA